MTKERLIAFTDAVIAIVMTILVLELEKPSQVSLKNFWELRSSFFAYTLSFFWIGAMWVNMHSGWHNVKKISNKVVWNTMFLLFFSSFFPYVTNIVSKNFNNETAQVFYGIIILNVSFFNILMYSSLSEISENKDIKDFIKGRKWIKYDIIIKIIGLILSLTIFPPAVMYSILITMVIFIFPLIIKSYL